ncbi:MAG TPA: CE1759 family FMN reductase [Solirubrobacterales bacterium]|nr:CE1759 family FMN reductase [Solirubrobacterales bacterium]
MSAPPKLVVVSAGASDPSSTSMLAERLAARTVAGARERGVAQPAVSVIELRTLASEIAAALVSQVNGPGLKAAIAELAEADGVIAATPIYKAGVSGLFKSFFDLLDNDLLIAKPVAMAATAGTARHALVVDEAMRSLFGYMRALTVPTALFAATEDWADPALEARIERTALELLLLMESRLAEQIREQSWGSYQHQYGSAGGAELEIDLSSDLMRLAAGGAARKDAGGAED